MQTLSIDFKRDTRFVLICNELGDESEFWTVRLVTPTGINPQRYSRVHCEGSGETPELAYRDMLKTTAVRLREQNLEVQRSLEGGK
jgi:hypothetical protein